MPPPTVSSMADTVSVIGLAVVVRALRCNAPLRMLKVSISTMVALGEDAIRSSR